LNLIAPGIGGLFQGMTNQTSQAGGDPYAAIIQYLMQNNPTGFGIPQGQPTPNQPSFGSYPFMP
jgi:hypothetical protein